jgi:hypothetical protein
MALPEPRICSFADLQNVHLRTDRIRRWRAFTFPCSCSQPSPPCGAADDRHGRLRMVWELNVAPLTANPERGAPDLLALRFLPMANGSPRSARASQAEGDRTELLLIPAGGDASKARRLQIRGSPLSTPLHTGIHWSPSGEHIAVETTNFGTSILRVSDGARCELPRATVFGGFIAPDKAMAADWEAPTDPASIPADVSTLTDLRNRLRAPEDVAGARGSSRNRNQRAHRVRRAEPQEERHSHSGFGRSGTRKLRAAGSASMLRFGEKGGALCKADYPSHGSLACYDLTTGQQFSNPDVIGGAPFDVSLDSSIVVATDGTASHDMRSGESTAGISNWVVWDYRTGREIARLRYRRQRHAYAFSPAAVAPAGRRFVVGAGGKLRMYEIAPE